MLQEFSLVVFMGFFMKLNLSAVTENQLDKLSGKAQKAAEHAVYTAVSKKDVRDLNVQIVIDKGRELVVDVEVDLLLDETSEADEKEIVERAVECALNAVEEEIQEVHRKNS